MPAYLEMLPHGSRVVSKAGVMHFSPVMTTTGRVSVNTDFQTGANAAQEGEGPARLALRSFFACTSAKRCIFDVTYSIAQNNVLSILAGYSYKWRHLAKTRGTTGYLEKRNLMLDLWCQSSYCFQLAPIFYHKICCDKNPAAHRTSVKARKIK